MSTYRADDVMPVGDPPGLTASGQDAANGQGQTCNNNITNALVRNCVMQRNDDKN